MDKEQHVTYETAILLKEKGFDWFTFTYYAKDDEDTEPEFGRESLCPDNWNGQPDEVNDLWYSAPTQQMALRWLREEKGIHIYPIPVTGFYYVVSVYTEQGNKIYGRILSRSGRHAYEEVIEAALEHCLTNLI